MESLEWSVNRIEPINVSRYACACRITVTLSAFRGQFEKCSCNHDILFALCYHAGTSSHLLVVRAGSLPTLTNHGQCVNKVLRRSPANLTGQQHLAEFVISPTGKTKVWVSWRHLSTRAVISWWSTLIWPILLTP